MPLLLKDNIDSSLKGHLTSQWKYFQSQRLFVTCKESNEDQFTIESPIQGETVTVLTALGPDGHGPCTYPQVAKEILIAFNLSAIL